VILVLALNVLIAFHATGPGEVCVVQEGGPLDGRGVAKVRQPGKGVTSLGIFNKQRCLPATERNYIISSRANEADSVQQQITRAQATRTAVATARLDAQKRVE
jgi:hypothetical protein